MLTTAGEVDGPSTYISDGWTSVSCRGPASAQLELEAKASSASSSETVAARSCFLVEERHDLRIDHGGLVQQGFGLRFLLCGYLILELGAGVIGGLLVADHVGRERSGEQHEDRGRKGELQRERIHVAPRHHRRDEAEGVVRPRTHPEPVSASIRGP